MSAEEEEELLLCVMWYFLSAMPQVGHSHPEFSARFKAEDIKMIYLWSQSQASIAHDHFLCALLTLSLRLMQMCHYEPYIGRPGDGASVCVCVCLCLPNDDALRRKWEENEQRKRVEEEEKNAHGG